MSDEITIPAPPLTWARIDASRVAEVITLPDGEQPADPGDWQDCTSVTPQPVVGMAYADGVYSLPRWAQIVGGKVVTVVEQIESPGESWRDCTGEHVGPGSGFAGDEFTAPAASPRHITVLAFRNRFTQSEKSLSKSPRSITRLQQCHSVRSLRRCEPINLMCRPRTISTSTAQTPAQACRCWRPQRFLLLAVLEILDAPIAAHEEFHP